MILDLVFGQFRGPNRELAPHREPEPGELRDRDQWTRTAARHHPIMPRPPARTAASANATAPSEARARRG